MLIVDLSFDPRADTQLGSLEQTHLSSVISVEQLMIDQQRESLFEGELLCSMVEPVAGGSTLRPAMPVRQAVASCSNKLVQPPKIHRDQDIFGEVFQ